MNILDKLKNLFNRGEIPDEAKSVFDGARTTRDLLTGLDAVLTRNEMESKKLMREIEKIDVLLTEEENKVKEGQVQGRQKRYTLQYIKRVRSQLTNLEHRMAIYDKNINLHINLIGKIQDMEAMALRGVDEKQIDQIIMEFEDHVDRYMDVVHAGEAGFEAATSITDKEDRELARLEKELVGEIEAPAIEPAVKEEPVMKKPVTETPAPTAPEPGSEQDDEEEDEVLYE